MSTIKISNIKVFVKNKNHVGDYFLITEDNLKFWVKDPENLLQAQKSNIRALECVMKGSSNQKSGKYNQYLVIKHIDWEDYEYVESIDGEMVKMPARPDYTGWSDEEIAADILARRKLEEKINGNSFVKFRQRVVESQKERHLQLVKSLKDKKHKVEFEDIEQDPTYMQDLIKEAHNLESKLGRSSAIGDGYGRLDAAPAYDLKHDLTWGMPPQNA